MNIVLCQSAIIQLYHDDLNLKESSAGNPVIESMSLEQSTPSVHEDSQSPKSQIKSPYPYRRQFYPEWGCHH